MATLLSVATEVMDKFYQNYAPIDAFFDIPDFKQTVSNYYNTTFNALFQQSKKELRALEGFSNSEMSAAWLYSESLPVQLDPNTDEMYVLTTYPIFAFDFDGYSNALNGLRGSSSVSTCDPTPKRMEFVKLSLNEVKFEDGAPSTNICYYFVQTNKRVCFLNRNPMQVTLYYVPAVNAKDDSCWLSDNILAQVVEGSLELFLKAKNGNFVKVLADQNPNIVTQQQANPNVR